MTAFSVGDAVIVPDDFCPGCMARTGVHAGIVIGFEDEKHAMLADAGVPGPFYVVLTDHPHNSPRGLVYGEAELGAVAT